MQKFKTFLLFFIITGMVSCLPKPKELGSQDEDLCNANFVIEQEVKGSLSISEEAALPEKFTLKLTACIQPQALVETKLASVEWAVGRNKKKLEDTIKEGTDIDNTTTLKHHDTIIKRKADVNGCIHWTEEYDYAYNSQSQWIVLNRHIGGIVKEYAGTCKIPLAVNPWLQLTEFLHIQVADYRKGFDLDNNILENRVEENGLAFLRRKKEEETKNKVNIIIENLDLHMGGSTPLSGKRILQENVIKAQLKYIIKDIYGNPKSERNVIKSGNFTVEPHLLIEKSDIEITKEKGKDIEVKEIEFIKLNENNNAAIQTLFKNETLETDGGFDWHIHYENYNPRSITVYLKVNPIGDTAKRVNNFEGVYYLGPKYQDVLSKDSHDLELNANLAAKKYFIVSDNQSREELSDTSSLRYKHPNQCFKKTDDVLSCLSMDKGPVNEEGDLRDGFGPAGWTVAKMNLRFFQMKKENWLSREISTIAETTISDPAHGGIDITQSDIIIQVTDLSSGVTATPEIINSDLNGNISFNIPTKQNWYNRQRYFLKIIHFSSESKELDIKRLVAINPWDYGFTHGFEVNHPKDIRTTCLTEEDKKAVSNLLEKDTGETTLSTEIKDGMSELDLVHKTFCHSPSDYTIGESPIDIQTEPEVHWTRIFNLFKNTLKGALRELELDPEKDFFSKFTSSKEGIKRPTAHVHLFRSINKYPTALIDNSLTREIYYNIRFKLSPRVVRHDDIAIGQQNKGPLRDGVHIFQMAILKNDQGKYDGNNNMVRSPEGFSLNISNGNKAGTVSIFSCPVANPECVTQEDFIIPPTNIPVIIREGMMKKDIPIYVKREYMLFANSKNLLVFRLIPADPASITCKDEHKECTMEDSEFTDSYEASFDWEKTLKSIKPACSLEDKHKCSPKYEMFFYTYKTPFIPSLWANWNITHELDINFDDLEAQHHLLQKNKDFNDRLDSLSLQATKSFEQYRKDQERSEQGDSSIANHQNIVPHPEMISELKDLEKEAEYTTHSINSDIDDKVRSETLNQIKTYLKNIEEQLQGYQSAIEQNTEMTVEQKEEELNRVAELLTEVQAQAQAPASVVSPIPPKEPETESELEAAQRAHNFRPKIFEKDNDTSPDTTTPPTLSSDICPGVTVAERNFLIQKGENDPCLEHMKTTDTRDLTHAHISHFASTNTLCTITATPGESLPKHCGNVTSSPHPGDTSLQRSFLDHLNKHINTLNTINIGLRRFRRDRAREYMNQFGLLRNKKPEPEQETEIETSPTAMRDSFKDNRYNQRFTIGSSKTFAFKLTDMPKLENLNLEDLENIISQGINDYTINNAKVGSFLYSLCGFWFSEFLSNQSQYVTADLLLDGFKQTVKNTLYYKLRGVTRPHEEDGDDRMQTLRAELNKLESTYDDYLKEQNLQGRIDDLHKWANNRKDFGVNPRFSENLHNQFQTLSQTKIFNTEPPSWIKGKSRFFPQFFREDNKNTDDHFHINHYLEEAAIAINIPFRRGFLSPIHKSPTDYHPIRKCIMNPSHFFGFEKKTIVGKIAHTQYEGQGVQTTLTISEDFLMNTQRDQGGNQQTELNLNSNLSLLAIPLIALGVGTAGLVSAGLIPMALTGTIAKLVATGATAGALVGFSGLLGGINYSYRTYEGTGKRRLFSLRVTEGVELLSETTPITMQLESYHECLVIRPRFSAFESKTETDIYKHIWNTDNHVLRTIYKKLGILLCAKGKTPMKTITETYHYIYPKYPINGITMDPSSHRNKPFAISLRGRKAYKKFIHNLSCYTTANTRQLEENRKCRDTRAKYEYLLRKNIEFAKNLKKGFDTPKMFHLTGDSPGVFSAYVEEPDREVENKTPSDDFLNYLSNVRWLDKEVENIVRDEE